jgi:hypothetical protein
MSKRLVIIHTTPVTISGLKSITDDVLSGYEIINLLDDSMLKEIICVGHITNGVEYRFNTMLMNAVNLKADGVLCACSSIGELAEKGSNLVNIPVFRIDLPMAEEAVSRGIKIGIAATLSSTLLPTDNLIRKTAQNVNKSIAVETLLINDVGSLLANGLGDKYDEIVAENITTLAQRNDIVVFAQASMARALCKVSAQEAQKCLTSPLSGLMAVKRQLGG